MEVRTAPALVSAPRTRPELISATTPQPVQPRTFRSKIPLNGLPPLYFQSSTRLAPLLHLHNVTPLARAFVFIGSMLRNLLQIRCA